MKWINVKDRLPPLKENVLVYAKEKSHLEYSYPPTIYCGFFYDDHENIKTLKKNIKFEVDCGCSGYEFDRADLEVLYWMPLPEPPKDIPCS